MFTRFCNFFFNFENITRLYVKNLGLYNIGFMYKIIHWSIIIFNISLIICNVYYILCNGVIICDSIEITSEVQPNTTQVENSQVENSEVGLFLGLKYKLSRKLLWLFKEKGSGQFNSYEEFKKTWTKEMSLRTELLAKFRQMKKNPIADFKETQANAAADLKKQLDLDSKLSEIKHQQDAALISHKMDRLNTGLKKR